MDENKIVPVPEDDAEKVEEPVAETEEIAEDISVEDAEIIDENEEFSEEEIFADEEDFADEDAVEDNAPKKKKKMKLGAKIAIGFLVVLVAFIIFCIVSVYIATRPPKVDFDADAMTVGETNISASEFFFYCSSVQGSSLDEIKQGAIDVGLMYNTLYAKAVKEGYKLSEEEKKSLEEELARYTAAAQAAGVSVDEYVASSISKGFTFDMLKSFLEKDMYVNSYFNSKVEGFKNAYKGDEGLKKLEEAYNKSKTENDVADFSYWYFVAGDGAEDKAKSVADAVKGGQTFADALKAVDETITAVTVTKETKATLESSFNADAASWLYKTNDKGEYANGTGAVEVFKDDSFVYVVYVNNAPSKNTVYPVTANYIKIAVDSETSVKTEEMNKIEAKKTADKILAEFLATDKSAEKLTEIAEKYTKENKKVTSSVFEGVTNDGTLDAALESWLFDEARKEKDVTAELIEADGAYYIVYYVKKAENAVWYDTILNTLISEDVSKFRNDNLAEGKKNFVVNDDTISDVMALVSYISSSSSYGY